MVIVADADKETRAMQIRAVERPRNRAADTSDEARWAAFSAADKTADGSFVTAVKTTGIYCRPSCPAKRAKRENVRFYATCAEAESAGFRPCKRCRPDAASRDEVQAEAVARACRLIEEAETPPALDALAQAAGMSPYHFHRTFRRITGVTPKAYAGAHRAGRVATGLRAARTVTEAVYDAGYNAASRFYAEAGERLGMSPTTYRQGGEGTAIRFAIGECSLGSILVAATAKGVCSIMMDDDPDALVRALQDRFPKAELTGGDAGFETLVAQVVGMADAPGRSVALPLDIHGTAFQQKVWEALKRIPAGTTATYTEVARAIGEPNAVRAVARACGANPVALAIPCHRVVRSDGSLSGYRWGVARKRSLIERERG
ncbi:bifunctional transcriptional activator/DNA repair enzyme protein Ada [Methylobacterium haplocladii]|uniref:methylated-DNA--[protein]-cysteine S-methyltransferase n=2 Tax=Methylobacterium haplocladii TaxID=1176176 RepID=A0A512ISK4_9HYPH|nr:bifunctional transcriptional activator/DNA repair enzyme protein Ada [Methylobacterium haplocladii]GLS60789.1 bifunctional transcriptional activator/DNA repair enzyme protein Ada [Methylobacterium haplocladii]